MAKNTRSSGQFSGMATVSTIHSGSVGTLAITSITRWITVSTAPE